MAASGKWKVVADILQHEIDENPAGGPVDSNPFGVLAEPGGRLVADAGASALLRVAANGTVETVAVFPPLQNPSGFGPPSIESVPTWPVPRRCLVRRPAGGLPVRSGTGEHLSRGPGTDPGGLLYWVQRHHEPDVRTRREPLWRRPRQARCDVKRARRGPLGLAAWAAQAATTAACRRAGWHIVPVRRCAG